MKKILIPALFVLALSLSHCKKDKDAKAEEEPAPTVPTMPSNPAATSNNGLAIISLAFGNSPSNGKMIQVDLSTNTAKDLPLPRSADDNFDVSPDGKKLVYIRENVIDTSIFIYYLDGSLSKKGLLKYSPDFIAPRGIHFSSDGKQVMFVNKGKIFSLDISLDASQEPKVVCTINSKSDENIGGPYLWNTEGTKIIAGGFGGNTNTDAHNMCCIDAKTGTVTRLTNGVDVLSSGYGKEITQAQASKGATYPVKEKIQNGLYQVITYMYGYRGWQTNGDVYYYSNREVFQNSPTLEGTTMALQTSITNVTKTDDAAEYKGRRILYISPDGKRYAAFDGMTASNAKIYSSSDNSVLVDLSSHSNVAQSVVGIRFANK